MAQELTTRKTIEQGRAKYAFEKVKEISNNSEHGSKKLKENYKSTTKKLPVLIKTNGLGQTLAFLKSKGGKKTSNAHDKLYEHIGSWLQNEDTKRLVKEGELVEQVINLESHDYRQVTVETLALFNWIRRFVDGLMKDVDEMEDSDA